MIAHQYCLNKKESESIQILRVIFTLMVVLIHADKLGVLYSKDVLGNSWNALANNIQYLISQIISRCSVPMFFFFSAVLLYRKEFSWRKNLEKKIKTLLLPYLLMNVFWIVFYALAQQISFLRPFFSNEDMVIANWSGIQWLDALVGIDDYPMLYPMWFLRDLFIMNVLSYAIKMVIDRFPKVTAVLFLVFWFLGFFPEKQLFISGGFCFWCMGYYVVKYGLHLLDIDRIKNGYVIVFYALMIVCNFICYNSGLYGIVYKVTLISGAFFWIKVTLNLKEGKIRSHCLQISKYCFFIYLFHEMYLTIFQEILKKVVPYSAFGQLAVFFLSVFIVFGGCIVLAVIMEKYIPKFYQLITGNR